MSNVISKALEPHLKPMNDKLQQLPEKDRKALLILAAFAAVLIFVFIIYLPAKDFHDRAKQNIEINQELHQWLQSKESQAKSLRKTPKNPGGNSGSLLTQVTEAVKGNGLALKRVQPEGSDRIRLWLEDAPFNSVITTLDQLQNLRGLTVDDVSFDVKKPGKIDARATISR